MVLNFNVRLFCENLRATKPPYECPVNNCGKVYRTYTGIENHMYNYDHCGIAGTSAESEVTSASEGDRGSGARNSERHQRSPLSREHFQQPLDFLLLSKKNKMVEVDLGSVQPCRVNVFEPLRVIVDDSDGECSEAVKDTNKNNAVAAKECSSRKDGCGSSSSSYPSPSNKLPEASFRVMTDYVQPKEFPSRPANYYHYVPRTAEEMDEEVEYDMDEMDAAWLKVINERRCKGNVPPVSKEVFELLMDNFEKESYFQSQVSEGHVLADEDAICCICLDGECHSNNVILFCDLCNLAVHQECYGVPHIPDGPWVCRRCLYSPSRAVSCCLCPCRRGAFKQTDDGDWAHVVCALWIPEVGFANSVFLEPIDSIDRVATARWKLTCCICKRRGFGACIQCHKTSCYTAFHVTCAQQAGLYMKVEPIRDVGTLSGDGPLTGFRKTAFCEQHSPKENEAQESSDNSGIEDDTTSPDSLAGYHAKMQEKVKHARKLLAENSHFGPVLSVPVIPSSSIKNIASKVSIQRKNAFISRLHSYWQLKRQSLNGVPLRRATRVSARQLIRSRPSPGSLSPAHSASHIHVDLPSAIENFRQCRRLRQQLEKVRLLLELIKKRERLKLEQVKLHEAATEVRLHPITLLLRCALDQIEPPADNGHLSELRWKLNGYSSVDEFASDLQQVIAGLLEASVNHSTVHRTAVKMKDQASKVLKSLRQCAERIGFDMATGLHSTASVDKPSTKGESRALVDRESERLVKMPENKVAEPVAVSGVNRRTMILFSKKARQQRLSAIQLMAAKDFEKKETIKIDSTRNDVSELSRRSTANGFAIKLPLQAETSVVDNAKLSLAKRPPAKRQHASSTGHTGSAICNGGVAVGNSVVAGVVSRSKAGISDDVHKKSNHHKIRVLDTSDMLNGISDSSDHSDSGSSRYPIRGKKSDAGMQSVVHSTTLRPLHCVWAKCRGFPWYPGMIINPKMPRAGYNFNGIHIPSPPESVLNLQPADSANKSDMYLILFFDPKCTWQWLHRDAVESLGVNPNVDTARLSSTMKPSMLKAVKQAYDRAMVQHRVISVGIRNS